ncbi:hypothetical protein AB0A98_06140 [Streptomyces chrestomyceticus]|uniref:hypothetical protein n=1 Tax=Streptomyces chrestomyceticus TaxID=68185 RepID=UPI0033C01D30
MITQQPPDMTGAYSTGEFDDKDAAAIHDGSMVAVSITLEKRHGTGDWAIKAQKTNFTAPADVVGSKLGVENVNKLWADLTLAAIIEQEGHR